MIVNFFVITAERLDEITFSVPLGITLIQFLRKPRTSQALGSFGLMHVFDTVTWICLGLMLAVFYVILLVERHPQAFMFIVATQLNQSSSEMKSHVFGVIMFINGLLITCAFSSGLLSSLSTHHSKQIATIDDFIAALKMPDTSMCLSRDSFFASALDNPGISAVLRALAQKKKDGNLILLYGNCFALVASSEKMITQIGLPSTAPYVGPLYAGREPLYVSAGVFPMSPGSPLARRVNELFGRLRDMHVTA